MTKPLQAAGEEWPLRDRPGFLIRRLYQIHVALFMERCRAFGITPVQYSILSALRATGASDQSTLASEVSLDKVTAGGTLRRLEERGLIRRKKTPHDRRARICTLTPEGQTLLAEMEPMAREAHSATVAALTPKEQVALMSLLKKAIASQTDVAISLRHLQS